MRDFESYYAAGATWRYEGDPYGRDVWRTEKDVPGVIATRDELLPFVGPPFGLPLWSALSRLPWDGAVRVWQAVMVLSLAALAFGSLRLAGNPIGTLDAYAVLVVCAGFGPLTSGLALGQVAIVATAAVVIAPLLLRRASIGLAMLAALGAALQPNLAIVLAARLGGMRAWIAFSVAAFVALAGSALAAGGISGFVRYCDVLRAHGAAERFIDIQTTPAAIARALGAAPTVAGMVALSCALAALAGTVLACASRRYAPDSRLALACAALPLTWPFAHEHDLTIVLLPAIICVRRARGALWVLAATSALVAATDWLGLAQRPTGAGATVLLTLAAALGMAALSRERLHAYHALPALVPFGVLAAALVAASHPAPTWPDALGLQFHVPATMPAAAVWRLEQTHSGIAALDRTSAWMRAASLVGCALLWLAASLTLRERRNEPHASRRWVFR